MAEDPHAKTRRNVQRMVDAGAPEEDIDDYLRSENITPAQLRAAKSGGPEFGSKEDVEQELERRRRNPERPPMSLQTAAVGRAVSINAMPQIIGAGLATGNAVRNVMTGKPANWVNEYGRERDIYKAEQDEVMREAGWGGTALEIMGGLAASPAKGAALALNTGEQAVKGVLPRIKNYMMQMPTAMGYGATYGSVAGFNDETGSWTDKFKGGIEGGVTGALLAPVVKAGFDVGIPILQVPKKFMDSRKLMRSERAQAVSNDQRADGLPEFLPVQGGPVAKGFTQMIDGSIVGEPTRAAARQHMSAIEKRLAERIDVDPAMTQTEAGNRIRGFAKRELLGDPEAAAAVTGREGVSARRLAPEERDVLSGVEPYKPPAVEPVPPKVIPPESVDAYLAQVERQQIPVLPRQIGSDEVGSRYLNPKPEEVILSPDLAKRLDVNKVELADAERRLKSYQRVVKQAEDPLLERMKGVGIEKIEWVPSGHNSGEGFYGVKIPKEGHLVVGPDGKVYSFEGKRGIESNPERLKVIEDTVRWFQHQPKYQKQIQEHEVQLERLRNDKLALRHEEELFRNEQLPIIAERRRNEARAQLEAEAQAEAAVASQKGRQDARDKAAPDAVVEVERRRIIAQEAENERAINETLHRQQEINALHAGKQNEPFKAGSTELPIKNQFDAAYDQIRAGLPSARPQPGETHKGGQRNLLGNKATSKAPPEQTRTRAEIELIAEELRGSNLLPGYKGNIFDETGALRKDVADHLRKSMGDEVYARLDEYSAKRATHQYPPRIQAVLDLRKSIDKAMRWENLSNGQPLGVDSQVLGRMRRAVNEDLKAFANEAGPRGQYYLKKLNEVDTEYARYMEDFVKPLAKYMSKKNDGAALFQDLAGATQQSARNFSDLRRVYELVDTKGDRLLNRTSLTGMILGDMQRGGMVEFATRYKNLSKEAKAVMFKGETEPLQAGLDRIVRNIERAAPYAKDAASSELGLQHVLRLSNLSLGAMAYANIPGAIVTAFGANMASRFFNSRVYSGWLKTAPIEKGPASAEFVNHLNKLEGYIAGLDNSGKGMEVFRELMGVKAAGALFAGEKSATADKEALKQAKAMQAAGEDPGKMWLQTGWYQGKDGVWRYEIDDKGSTLTKVATDAFKKASENRGDTLLPLQRVVGHKPFFDAYPEAKDWKVRFAQRHTDGVAAEWDGKNKLIILNVEANRNLDELRSTLLHEIQHGLGEREGQDYGPMYGNYNRRYGEVEARNVERRRNMDERQRRDSHPVTTQDVPPKNVLLERPRAARGGAR